MWTSLNKSESVAVGIQESLKKIISSADVLKQSKQGHFDQMSSVISVNIFLWIWNTKTVYHNALE